MPKMQLVMILSLLLLWASVVCAQAPDTPPAGPAGTGDAPSTNLWPLPADIRVSGQPVPLSPHFKISTASKSTRLARAIERYSKWIAPAAGDQRLEERADFMVENNAAGITGLEITVTTGNENLTAATSYAYNVSVTSASASVVADTVYGAIYGLETFSQFVHNGQFNHSSLLVQDMPRYPHRGLMIDTGRRFFPPELVMELLDAMSYMKLNVLHFHLSDLCRFSIESHMYPALTASSQGFYTQDDIVKLVAYAKDRGIRVVPEFDVPGHSHGFLPLAASDDVVFCSSTQIQLCNDAQNKTITTLKRLFLEMSTLFDDELFHIGCDETGTTPACPLSNTRSLEVELLEYLRSIGRTPMGWEEVLFGTNAATPYTVIDTWSRHNAAETTPKGFRTVESSGSHFYVNHATTPYTSLWTDIATNISTSDLRLLLGGEFSMWSDNYCYISQCYRESSKPVASWMYNRTEDKAFSSSVTAMIWPRGIAAAGSFWNYQASLDASSAQFLSIYNTQTDRLISRGIASCPAGCKCDELTQCGKPYPHSGSRAEADTVV